MATYMDMTAANAWLKEYYNDQKVNFLVYDQNPTLAMMPKDEDAVGEYIPIPTVYETSQGASASFSTAQTNQVPMQAAKFLLTLCTDYSLDTIQNQVILASGNDKGSFARLGKKHVEGTLRRAKNRAGAFIFRSGTGSIGAIATGGITSGVITLSNPADVVHFGVNQTLQANATDGGASPRAALGYVIAVNRGTGTVTVASSGIGGAAGSPSGWTAGDFLLTQGDNNAVMKGLLAWVPASDPTSTDNFYGVNRSADVTRLGGVRYTGTSYTIEEALINSSMLVAREGGMTSTGIAPYASYGALVTALGSKKTYDNVSGPAGISYQGVKVIGANSEFSVFPDRSCPAATAFLLQMDTWKLYSLGQFPGILRSPDGLEMLRVYNADAAEVRAGGYSNAGCEAPGWNAYVSLAV